jgi:hypothetical protein
LKHLKNKLKKLVDFCYLGKGSNEEEDEEAEDW